MNDIVYPIILTYIDERIFVEIPDFKTEKCATYGNNVNDTIKKSKELLKKLTLEHEDIEKKLPKRSNMKEIRKKLKKNQEAIYISLWLPF
ncbi:hypothetical protein H3N56_03105 [Cetobacterium sp. 2A]|uniref:hypothetical protein n=1 Tax=Cetobacterium sp. 2A TaxID=2754723 RepID=UPI00163CE2B3|nr:hypothetical protein [Cetobacterium sp. 2A]MBC2855483.1 hypothetical protein [Cetobacterium sp. 2A]